MTATFTFTIAAVPDAPRLSPVGGDAQDGAVALQWTPGNANGSPITEYEVRWNGGQKVCGAVTTCQVTGLKNGTTYLFTVRAKNAVGWSADSNQVEGKPDRAPEAPANVEMLVVHLLKLDRRGFRVAPHVRCAFRDALLAVADGVVRAAHAPRAGPPTAARRPKCMCGSATSTVAKGATARSPRGRARSRPSNPCPSRATA